MSNNIDVHKIGEKVFEEIRPKFEDGINKMKNDVINASNNEEQMVAMIAGASMAIREHCERFTMKLVQEVVDKLNSSNQE